MSPRPPADETPAGLPPAEIHTLDSLDQLRILADPLRVRILESFCRGTFTTKQVAQQLGEKPTRLYHHVEALERVGLVRLSGTRQNRGTVEKYYTAIARAFRADSSLFSSEGAEDELEVAGSVISTFFERTVEDLRALIRAGGADCLEEEGIVSFIEIHAEEEEIAELTDKLKSIVEEWSLKDALSAFFC